MRWRKPALSEVFRNIEAARIDLSTHLLRNETFQYGYRVRPLSKFLVELRAALGVLIKD